MILVSLLKQRCIILYAFVNIKNKSLLKQKKKKKTNGIIEYRTLSKLNYKEIFYVLKETWDEL